MYECYLPVVAVRTSFFDPPPSPSQFSSMSQYDMRNSIPLIYLSRSAVVPLSLFIIDIFVIHILLYYSAQASVKPPIKTWPPHFSLSRIIIIIFYLFWITRTQPHILAQRIPLSGTCTQRTFGGDRPLYAATGWKRPFLGSGTCHNMSLASTFDHTNCS